MKMTFDKIELDVSKLEVNKEYRIEFDSKEFGHTTINRAFIKSVDVESNTLKFEPLAEIKEQEELNSGGFSFTINDIEGNTVLKVDK